MAHFSRVFILVAIFAIGLALPVSDAQAATTPAKKTTAAKTTTAKKTAPTKKTTTAKKSVAPKKSVTPKKSTAAKKTTAAKTATTAKKSTSTTRRSASVSRSRSRRARARYSPWAVPTYADSTIGDVADGEDPIVRQAAVSALGTLNGVVVVANANTGRILSMVNQKTALETGYIPCSTVKVPVSLAGLYEGMIDSSTTLTVLRRKKMDLTEALAKSNNVYFERVGQQLGFEKLIEFHRHFGLGEKAGLNIEGESTGELPAAPPKNGGAARMSSFGEGISLTALQLTALMGAIANGGTLYYLQHPRSQEDLDSFVPRVKRSLDIEHVLADVKRGMSGAVSFGTARQAAYEPEAPIYGKTGTCTDYPRKTHMGWFGSFYDGDTTDLAVVVMLTGASGVSGPRASLVAGKVYANLKKEGFFEKALQFSPVALIETPTYNLND